MRARSDEDGLFWRVEVALAECMVKVATTYAKGGGQVVVLCSRKLTADQEGRLSFAGVKVVSTRPPPKAPRVFSAFPLEQPPRAPIPSPEPPALLRQRNPRVCEECEGPCRPGAGQCDDCKGRGERVAADGTLLRPGPEPADVY